MTLEELKHNINICENKIQKAMQRCGRSYNVEIVGASKTMTPDVIKIVNDNKLLNVLGENKAQELIEKYEYGNNIKWHFIGTLQSNKVKYIVDKVDLIHSVDRISIAQEIDRQSAKLGIISNILIQINMGKEGSKSGFYLEDIEDVIQEIILLDNVRVRGLMAVMPIADNITLIDLYRKLGKTYDKLKSKYEFDYLSAGMTNDYELAIEYAGSNLVRIGRAIFGDRL